ncbi:MAG: hypothetical protein IT431_14640 [Phycisphaerales bacterium]|nr:hypothetical protein [Phycisphaerales bacterium]
MAKYDPLRNHLTRAAQPRLTMTFDQVAALVGPLPRSVWDHRAWWANDPTHVHGNAWLAAGYRVDSVDQSRGIVTFVNSGSQP